MINNLFNPVGTSIHCTTKELALETLSILDSMGYKWSCGNSLLESPLWEFYESRTCYKIVAGKGIVCNSRFELESIYILQQRILLTYIKIKICKNHTLKMV